MEPKTALHTAARRYCADRFSTWASSYEQLQAKENFHTEKLLQPGWTYSDDAYKIFPRYRLDSDIQVEIERLRPELASTLEDLRGQLLRAADMAQLRLLQEFAEGTARNAISAEADDYRAYVRVLVEADLRDVLPLPFRRVLSDDESKEMWAALRLKWNLDEDYWFPLKKGPLPEKIIAFHTDYFIPKNGAELLRSVLASRKVKTVFQLHEFGSPNYEIELESLVPRYANGGEQYCTSESMDWLVYASHESSLTIAGDWLVEAFKSSWPDWQARQYGGAFSTDDLRGTWETK